MPMGVSSPLTLVCFIFVIVTACMFQFVGPVCLYFEKNFPNFLFGVQGCQIGFFDAKFHKVSFIYII